MNEPAPALTEEQERLITEVEMKIHRRHLLKEAHRSIDGFPKRRFILCEKDAGGNYKVGYHGNQIQALYPEISDAFVETLRQTVVKEIQDIEQWLKENLK